MKKLFCAVTLTLALALLFATPVFAQGETPPPSTLEIILAVVTQFASLAGVGAVIAAVVNILKYFGVIADGNAGRWFAGFNLAAIALLVYLKLFQPEIAIEYIDAQAAVLAQVLLLILGYVVQLGSGLFAHGLFADLRLPVIGVSHTRARKTDWGRLP